ncbi:DUF309 domain-containing protein [Microlunatus ginsengisoli]|uniref:DUF309 domain-containing protein n=1 Tax=Microlunatus ginsengisoli TaxID=363863 RepID=A0ABP6ZAW1_9ACTN
MTDISDRDRDIHGKARNARPRDQLGRPLPRGQIGVPPWPENLTLTPEKSLSTAQALLDRGRPFQAHEVLETAWKSAPAADRGLWKGLAQLAVGVTHAARGNLPGADALLRRGREALRSYQDSAPHHIDASGLSEWATRSLQRVAAADDHPIIISAPRLCRTNTPDQL